MTETFSFEEARTPKKQTTFSFEEAAGRPDPVQQNQAARSVIRRQPGSYLPGDFVNTLKGPGRIDQNGRVILHAGGEAELLDITGKDTRVRSAQEMASEYNIDAISRSPEVAGVRAAAPSSLMDIFNPQGERARRERMFENDERDVALDAVRLGDLELQGLPAEIVRRGSKFAGAALGSVATPTGAITGAIPTGGVVATAATNATGNALLDLFTQGIDTASDTQDEIDLRQTGFAAATGAAVPTAIHGAGRVVRAIRAPRPEPVVAVPPERQLLDNSDRILQGYDPRPDPIYPPQLAPPRPVDASTPLREEPPARVPSQTYRVRRNGEDVEVYISKPMTGSRKTHTVTPLNGGPSFPVRPDRLVPNSSAVGRSRPVLTNQHYDYRGQRVVVESVDGDTATIRTLEPNQQGPARIRGVSLAQLQETTDAYPTQRDRPTSFSGELAPTPEPRDPNLIEGPPARVALPPPERTPSRYPSVADPVRDRLAANANTVSAREGEPSTATPLTGRERGAEITTTRTVGPPDGEPQVPANDIRPRPALATRNSNPRTAEPAPEPEPPRVGLNEDEVSAFATQLRDRPDRLGVVADNASREEVEPRNITNGSVYKPGERLSAADKQNARNYGYEPAIWRQLKPEERANIVKTPPAEWLKLSADERARRAQGPAPVAPDGLRGRQNEGPVMPQGVKPITARAQPTRGRNPNIKEVDAPDVPLGNYGDPDLEPVIRPEDRADYSDVPFASTGDAPTPPPARGEAAIDAVRRSLEQNRARLAKENNPDVRKGIQKVIDLQEAKLREAGVTATPEPKVDAELRLTGADGKPVRGSRDEIIDYIEANNLPDRFQPYLDLDEDGNFFTIIDADAKRAARAAELDKGPEGPNVARITNEPEVPRAKPAPEDKPLGPRETRDVTPEEMAQGEGNFSVTDRRRMQRRVDKDRANAGLAPLRETPRDAVEGRLTPVDAAEPQNTLIPSDNPRVRPNFEDNVDVAPNENKFGDLTVEELRPRYEQALAEYREARAAREAKPTTETYAREDLAREELDAVGRDMDAALERKFPVPLDELAERGEADVRLGANGEPTRRGPNPQDPRTPADKAPVVDEPARRNTPVVERIAESETTKNLRQIVDNTRTALGENGNLLRAARRKLTELGRKDTPNAAIGRQKMEARIAELEAKRANIEARLEKQQAKLDASTGTARTAARSLPDLQRKVSAAQLRVEDKWRDVLRHKKGTERYETAVDLWIEATKTLKSLEDQLKAVDAKPKNILDDESGELRNPFRKRTPEEIKRRNDDILAATGDDKARKLLIRDFTEGLTTSRLDRATHNAILFLRGGDISNLREFARRYKDLRISPETAKAMERPEAAGMNPFTWVADQIGTDPGSGRVVGQQVENAISQRAAMTANRVEDIFARTDVPRPKDKAGRVRWAEEALAEREAVRGLLTTLRVGRKAGAVDAEERAILSKVPASRHAAVRKMAEDAKAWFAEYKDYLEEAGVEIGTVREYLNRIVDEKAVRRDPETFVKLLKEQYIEDGASRGAPVEPDVAELQARAVLDKILHPYNATFAGDLNLPDALPRSAKGRVLSETADRRLAPFYIRDPQEAMTVYAQRMATAAEQTRRFGPRGEVLQTLFDDLRLKMKDGVISETDYQMAHNAVQTGRGVSSTTRNFQSETFNGFMSWVQTTGTLAVLGRTAFLQVTEPVLVASRLNKSALTAAKAWAQQWDQLAADLGSGTRGAKEAAAMARAIGVTGQLAREITIDAINQGKGRNARALTSLFLKMQFTATLTHQQRTVAIRMAEPAFRSALDDIAAGKPNIEAARSLVGEYGIDDAKAKRLSAWLKDLDDVPFDERLAAISDTYSEEAGWYRAMLGDFAKKTIVEPTAADLPTLAKNPYTRASYGIASFAAAFTREHRNRMVAQLARAMNPKNKLSAGDRLTFANAAFNHITLYMPALAMMQALREYAFGNSSGIEDRNEIETAIAAASQSGLFGNGDPLMNLLFPKTRFSTSSVRLVGSDYLSMQAQSIDKMLGAAPWNAANSPANNSAEHRAARGAYDLVGKPAAAAAVTLATPGPLRPAGGVANMALTSGKASKTFADLVVGEKGEPTKKPGERSGDYRDRVREYRNDQRDPRDKARRERDKRREAR